MPHRFRPTRPAALALVAALLTALPSAAETAAERIVAAMDAAATAAPGARRANAELGARTAADHAAGASGTWRAEVQREGFESFFDDADNATEYLRLAAPWSTPRQARAGRRLGESSDAWLDAARSVGRLERAGEAGRLWLELAAQSERVELVRGRLERMDRALVLQRKRLELGEVSGTEVMQLELERANDSARLRTTVARRSELLERLKIVTGDDFPRPKTGDLDRLVDTTSTAPADLSAEPPDDGLGASVLVAEAERAAELEARRGELTRATAHGRPEAMLELERVPTIDGVDGFTAWGFAVSVPLPFGRLGRERIAEAELQAEAARAAAEERRLAIRGRLRTAEAATYAAEALLTELAPTLERVPKTEHSLAEQYRLGAISYLVYIDGLARLDGVRVQAIDARRDLLRARLERAVVTEDTQLFPLPDVDTTSKATAGDTP